METWYRGESTKASPANAGGFLHDLGDGVYFTNDLGLAQIYARKRVQESGGAASSRSSASNSRVAA